MAVINSIGATAFPRRAAFKTGKVQRVVNANFAITAAGSSVGDQYILAGPLSGSDRIAGIVGNVPALTSAADNDFGFFYKDANGDLVELDKDVLLDGVTLASALTYRDLLKHFSVSLDTTKTINEHLDLQVDTEPFGGIYLVMTTNTASTATGPLYLNLDVLVDEGTSL